MTDDVAAPRCQFCGGALAPQVNLAGARRCLSCGKGTVPPCGAELDCGGTCTARGDHAEHECGIGTHHHPVHPNACGAPLACGGECFLPKRHGKVPCHCKGDTTGPGTCPVGMVRAAN